MVGPLNNILPKNPELHDAQTKIKLNFLKISLAATSVLFVATPLVRSFLPWKRLPLFAAASYGCTLAACHLWSKRQSKLGFEKN